MTTPASIHTGQVTLTASVASLIVAARASRHRLIVQFDNGTSNPPLAVGDSFVTATSGLLVYPRASSGAAGDLAGYLVLETGAAVYGIATGADCHVSFVETFD